MNTIDVIENLIAKLSRRRQILSKELHRLPQGNLSVFENSTGIRCNVETIKNGVRLRKGITKDKELVRSLARKKLLTEQLRRIDSNIGILRKALPGMADDSINASFASLPEKCRLLLPQDYFIPDGKQMLHPVYDNTEMQQPVLCIPDALIPIWGSMPYRANAYHLEEKRIIMSDGLHVRSKSEASIIEIYRKLSIPIHYDELLVSGLGKISPDVIALRPDGKLIYHEHCGLTNDPQYMERHKKKMSIYESLSIVPWNNLIVTYDGPDNSLDIALIEAEIKSKLC